MEPSASILIPVHNCCPWVARAIESALAQTWPATEVIVLDDGSTDGSTSVIERYRQHLRIESYAAGGQNRSRNRLTELSRSGWLVYLDADDELAPNSVEEKMKCCAGADAVYGSMEMATFAGSTKLKSVLRAAVDYDDPWVAAFQWKYPNTSSFMFRRSAVIGAGQWDESIRVCTDYDLYFRLLLSGNRLKAAPGSASLYRHWSVAQAVHTKPMRRVLTRLRLMRRAAAALERSHQMTRERKRVFEQSTLECIRSIYHFNRPRARVELRRLVRWNPEVIPSPNEFARLYVLAFRVGGIDFAEALARWSRGMRKAVSRGRDVAAVDYDHGAPHA